MRWLGMICSLMVLLGSCKRDQPSNPNFGYSYLPIEVGSELLYQVDSTYFSDFTGSDSTYSFTQKELIAETFSDAAGRLVYRIEQSRRYSDTAEFEVVGSYSIYKDNSLVEKTENNLRLVPLVFPVKSGHEWNGNAFNTRDESDFRYQFIDKAVESGGVTYDSVLSVLQLVDTQNFVVKRLDEEQYARNIGLIYKEHLYTVRKNNGDSGVHIISRLIP